MFPKTFFFDVFTSNVFELYNFKNIDKSRGGIR